MLKIDGKHINVFPRKDQGPTAMKPENMRLTGSVVDGVIKLNISDVANPEFYVNVEVSADQLTQSGGISNMAPNP